MKRLLFYILAMLLLFWGLMELSCASAIGISVPVSGGNTKCFEWDTPAGHYKPETETPFKVNGKEI